MLSGEIPRCIGSCTNLRELKIAGNFFHGSIPPSLSSLKSIEVLNFSCNNLAKKIPGYLESLLFLQTLDLSFNDFEGEIPLGGVFRNASAVSIVGNSKLCGGVPELQLPKCSITKASRKHGVSYALKLGAPIFSGTLVLILMLFYVFVYKGIHTKKVSCSLPCDSTTDILPKVSYESLYRATDGFSAANLIGLGKFSSVYKGLLKESETVVAVKVLNLNGQGASKSFVTQCEALRLIRHRNLVKVLTTCSSIDFQGNNFKAIVYAYMVHGILDGWLHKCPKVGSTNEKPRILNLLQRLNIAIDVACALDYLHYHCGTPLVHCDLKPSNVLLDSKLVAHVGDFGLAKFLAEATTTCASYQASSIGIIGTIGYAAPENGMGCEVSTSGDVYSYGILLLEIFTGRRPTNDMFNNGLNLHNFAKIAIPGRVMEISDPALVHTKDEEIT